MFLVNEIIRKQISAHLYLLYADIHQNSPQLPFKIVPVGLGVIVNSIVKINSLAKISVADGAINRKLLPQHILIKERCISRKRQLYEEH